LRGGGGRGRGGGTGHAVMDGHVHTNAIDIHVEAHVASRGSVRGGHGGGRLDGLPRNRVGGHHLAGHSRGHSRGHSLRTGRSIIPEVGRGGFLRRVVRSGSQGSLALHAEHAYTLLVGGDAQGVFHARLHPSVLFQGGNAGIRK